MYSYYGQMKHKVFTSFYHADDQKYKNYIDQYLSGGIINKSVMNGEYNSDNSDEYIKRLIREDKVSDSSVVVVLVGSNTWKRKHVDWEIYAGLRASVNGNSGLVGILLPTYPVSYNGEYSYSNIPSRLADNIESGYAKMYSWDYAINNFNGIIEDAYNRRITDKSKVRNGRIQMSQNL